MLWKVEGLYLGMDTSLISLPSLSLCHLQVMRSYFKRADPFFDEQENHSLIGVANVFLSCLFYDVKLQYAVPIINQKGEVKRGFKHYITPGSCSLGTV